MTLTKYVLLVIVTLSFLLRILAVYPGHPFISPDEPIIKDSAIRIGLSLNFKPTDYYYGQLLPIIYGSMYIIFFTPLLFFHFFVTHIKFFIDHGLFFSIDFFKRYLLVSSDPTNYFHYAARYSTAIISSLTVIPVYLLGKRLFNKEVGLVAAFLMAVNYRHVLSSNVVLADAPAAFFASLSTLLSVILLKDKSKKAYIFAGIGMALALSVKYFVYVVPVFLLCHAISYLFAKRISLKNKIKTIVFNKNLALSLVICVILFLALNPYLLFDNKTAQAEFIWNSGRYGLLSYKPTLFNFTRGDMSLIPFYYLFWTGLTPLVSIAAILGFVYGFVKFTKSTVILSSVLLPFFFVFTCVFGDPFFRNFSAIIPFIVFLPAIFIDDLSSRIKNRKYALVSIIILTLIIANSSFSKSLATTLGYTKPHNEKEFGKWIDKNMPADKIGSFIAMQVLRNEGVLEMDNNYSIHKTENISSLSDMKERNIKFVAVSSYKTPIKNRAVWIDRRLVVQSFFSKNLFWNNIEDTYYSLLLQEMSEYSVKQFLKPFESSTDRAIFVAKIPNFWQPFEDRKIRSYTFESLHDQEDFSVKPNFVDGLGYMDTKGLLLKADQCNLGAKISSNKFLILENRWYTFVGLAKHNNALSNNENGFLRIDFYSKNNTKLKTYVSGLVSPSHDWQRLVAAGIAPKSSVKAVVTVQADYCLADEGIIFDNLNIYSSDKLFFIDNKEYPFYGKKIPRNFLWSNEN